MKHITLIHNPTAGDKEYSEKELIALIEKKGFECRYLSTKEKEWKKFNDNTDLLVIAGGDGTVRKTIKELLNRKNEKPIPITLLPLGSANNIANTLGVQGDAAKIISSWKEGLIKKIDMGMLTKLPGAEFFLEGFGYGVFPLLMKKMKEVENEHDSVDQSLNKALKLLHQIVIDYVPKPCQLEVDGTDHSGNFVLVEIMNTKSIGPNLMLSELSDPGDGELEVVLVPEKHKAKFAQYILEKLNGAEKNYQFHTLKGKKIRTLSEGTHIHVDDELIKLEKPVEIKTEIKEAAFDFLVPPEEK